MIEKALFQLGIEFEKSEALKNHLYMLVMLILINRIDEYIIHIDDYTHIQEVTEDIIHHVLEGSRGIGKTKRYDSILKLSISGLKSCFLLITS